MQRIYKSITDKNLYSEHKKSLHRENRVEEEYDFVPLTHDDGDDNRISSSSNAGRFSNSNVLTPDVQILPKKTSSGRSTLSIGSGNSSSKVLQSLRLDDDEVTTIVKESALLGQLTNFSTAIQAYVTYDAEDEAILEALKVKRRNLGKYITGITGE